MPNGDDNSVSVSARSRVGILRCVSRRVGAILETAVDAPPAAPSIRYGRESCLEILRKRLPGDARMLALLDNAVQGARRGTTLTQRMLAFARRQELKHETVELCGLINGMTELLERSLGPTVNIETRFPRELVHVRTDANQLETALLNLAINGRDAMPHGGSMAISVATQEVSVNHFSNLLPGKYACLAVKDSGDGMDEATLAKATEPFFTTKGVGKGTDLGLSMLDGLAGQSGVTRRS